MADLQMLDLQRRLATSNTAVVDQADRAYRENIKALADTIVARGTRVLLLAGPSGSGKTTTANILADTLRAGGHDAMVISLDNFYRSEGDPAYPLNDKGEPDWEAPGSLCIDMIRSTILDIEEGREVHLPRFDFRKGVRIDNDTTVQIAEGGCAIIEGLHALNPMLTEGIPHNAVTKVFISVSTNIMEGDTRILSGRKIRFVRRLTRDYLYRASSALRTLALWDSVLAGEDKYLYPFRDTADIHLDTFHTYELGVMKPYTLKVIQGAGKVECELLRIVREALSKFDTIPERIVPQDSLIREFIPGGIYESLY